MIDAQVLKKYHKQTLDKIASRYGGIIIDEQDGVDVDTRFQVIHKNGYRISHVRQNKIILIGLTRRTRSLIFKGKMAILKRRYNLTYEKATNIHNGCHFASKFYRNLAYNDQIITFLVDHRDASFWHQIDTDNICESSRLYPELYPLSLVQIKTLMYLWLYVTYISGETL